MDLVVVVAGLFQFSPSSHLLHVAFWNELFKLWNLNWTMTINLHYKYWRNILVSINFKEIWGDATWRIQSKILLLATLKILAAAYWLCFFANRATSNCKERIWRQERLRWVPPWKLAGRPGSESPSSCPRPPCPPRTASPHACDKEIDYESRGSSGYPVFTYIDTLHCSVDTGI